MSEQRGQEQKDHVRREVTAQERSYSLDAIIALQKLLENGIPTQPVGCSPVPVFEAPPPEPRPEPLATAALYAKFREAVRRAAFTATRLLRRLRKATAYSARSFTGAN